MSIVECAIAVQTSGNQTQPSNTFASGYFMLALIAVLLGMVVLIIIRARAKRTSKE